MTSYYLDRKNKHLCTYCGKPTNLTTILCVNCKEAQRNSRRKRDQNRREQHLCVKCGVPAIKDRTYCEEHFQSSSASAKKRFRNRQITGVCMRCSNKAYAGVYCEEHWFKEKARKAFGNSIYHNELKELLVKQNYICPLTGRKLLPGINASVDHIVPISSGGSSSIDNLQWIDVDANYAKSNLSLDDFLQLVKDISIHKCYTLK